MSIKESIFFFPGSDGRKLLGMVHLPEECRSHMGIVFSHPFAEEKNCSHAITVKAARAFASLGFAVFRFDFSGCGDSEGDLEDARVEDWVADLDAAIVHFQSVANVERVALWGLRLGGGLALLYSQKSQYVDSLILWQPVVDLAEYIRQFLRQKLGAGLTQGRADRMTLKMVISQLEHKSVEVIGYTITPDLFNSFVNVGQVPSSFDLMPIFLTTISLTDTAPFSIKQYFEALSCSIPHVTVDHVIAEPFWDRYWCWDSPLLIDRTGKWLRSLHLNG